MRTEQILLALSVSREHSIKAAADALSLSPANASIMLKTLEKELGYCLFERTPQGMVPTEKGCAFMNYASQIERSLHGISRIPDLSKHVSLRILAISHDCTKLAFEKLCKKHCNANRSVRMSMTQIDQTEDAKKGLENGEADVVVSVCRKSMYDSLLKYAVQKQIAIESISEQNLEITCKRGHPLLANGEIDYDRFIDYPAFLSIRAVSARLYVPYFMAKRSIAIKSIITANPNPVSYQLLKDVNGYMISLPVSEAIKEEYGLESAVIKDTETIVFAAYFPDAGEIDLIHEYCEYCKEFISGK